MWIGFVAVLAVLSGLVTVNDGWDRLLQTASRIWSAILTALTSPVSVPLWVFFAFITLASFGASSVVRNYAKRYMQPALIDGGEKPEVFRDLLYLTTKGIDGELVVLNEQAPLCGICNGRIVSTDTAPYNTNLRYLVCEEGHYIGQDIKYSDYMKAIEAYEKQREPAREESVMPL